MKLKLVYLAIMALGFGMLTGGSICLLSAASKEYITVHDLGLIVLQFVGGLLVLAAVGPYRRTK